MSGSDDSPLSNASNDANQNMSPAPAGSPTQSCGDAPTPDTPVSPEKKSWIAIKLVDQANKPIPREAYRVKLPDGSTVEGDLDAKGCARIGGIDPGTCVVTFPNIDARDWKKA